jgi:hypothetical protein
MKDLDEILPLFPKKCCLLFFQNQIIKGLNATILAHKAKKHGLTEQYSIQLHNTKRPGSSQGRGLNIHWESTFVVANFIIILFFVLFKRGLYLHSQ